MATGTPLGRMVVELGLDDTSFAKGVEGAKKQISYFSKEMQANMRIADMAGDKLGVYSAKHEGLTKIIKAEEQRVTALSKAFETSKDENGKLTNQSIRYANQLEQARGNLARYNKQLAINAGEAAKWRIENEGFTGALNKTGKAMSNVGEQGMRLGKTLTVGVTTPIVAGVGMVTKAAMSWESAFAGVKKTNDEVVDSSGKVVYSYKDLENGLRGLAKELPATHEEIASVAEAAGQLGIKSENVVGFTKTMIDLGESTNMSAEVAATSLARLANITKMPQTEFDRLGSSITELGNNFATTESEIVEMALRLAGAGKQVGMSEADILGLSAALSSVGIEAEMGGSAISKTLVNMQVAATTGLGKVKELEQATGMTRRELELMSSNNSKGFKALADSLGMTTAEMNKVVKAGKNLEGFAAVAGMTGEQFKKAFEQDAVGALGKFIDGLDHAEDKGSSAIEVLEEMGISEVRLRDSLLRTGNASELLKSAIRSSNEAWNENTALTEEANKRYETLESQLGMARNEVKDIAIELGGPLVRAFRDGLQASKPMLKTLSELATKFSEADPKTQQMVMKMIAYTAAAGPVIGMTSKITKGIGDMTQGTIKFLGSFVGKSTTDSFLKQITGGAKSIDAWKLATQGATQASKTFGPQVATSATTLTKFGSAATASSGFIAKATTSIGGFTGALGLLTSPLGLTITALGVTGVAAWKLWGEEAWNSAQRTRQWGTDVGESVGNVLAESQKLGQTGVGQFEIFKNGAVQNTAEIADNFSKMGETMEKDLSQRINNLKGMLDTLPKGFEGQYTSYVNEYAAKLEKSKQEMEKHATRVSEIRRRAIEEGRELSIVELTQIQDSSRKQAEAYINTLDISKSKRKEILQAMTADVNSATREQSEVWVRNLGEQRAKINGEYAKQIDTIKKNLKKDGYDLNGEFAQGIVKMWEDSRDVSIESIDNQISALARKFPELADKIFFANGQIISGNADVVASMKKNNQDLLATTNDMTRIISDSTNKNAEELKMSAKASNDLADTWNNIVLDPKTMKVKTNAVEEVKKATVSQSDWQKLFFNVKRADLGTNAKLVLAEAALANGHWSTLEFAGKEALIESNATVTIIEALQANGDWDKMDFEAKKAILYSDTPEKIAESLISFGLWDKYEIEAKNLGLNNVEFYEKMAQSKGALESFNKEAPLVKKLLAEDEVTLTAGEAKEAVLQFNRLDPAIQKLLLQDEEFRNKLYGAEEQMKTFDQTEALGKIDLETNGAQSKINEVDRMLDELGIPRLPIPIQADSSNAQINTSIAQKGIDTFNATQTPSKVLSANNSDAVSKTNRAQTTVDLWNRTQTPNKNLNANTNAPQVSGQISQMRTEWNNTQGGRKTFTFRTVFETIGKAVKGAFGHEKGTNFLNQAGPIMVNDQAGPLYKEIVHQPGDIPRIYEGRNVIIPHAKRGTKVYKAVDTKRIMLQAGIPRFAEGTGVSPNAEIVKTMRRLNDDARNIQNKIVVQGGGNDNFETNRKLDVLISIMSQFGNDLRNLKLEANAKELASVVDAEQKYRSTMIAKTKGVRS